MDTGVLRGREICEGLGQSGLNKSVHYHSVLGCASQLWTSQKCMVLTSSLPISFFWDSPFFNSKWLLRTKLQKDMIYLTLFLHKPDLKSKCLAQSCFLWKPRVTAMMLGDNWVLQVPSCQWNHHARHAHYVFRETGFQSPLPSPP